MDEPDIKNLGRLEAAIQSIQTATKALEHSEQTVARVARHIKRAERVLYRIRAADASAKR